MKSNFIIAGLITAVLIIILSFSLVVVLFKLFKRKYYPESVPTLAQSLVLSGRLLAGFILIVSLFGPIREFLTITTFGKSYQSVTFYSFVFTGCCILTGTYIILILLEEFLIRLVFKGSSVIVELQENNMALATVKFAMTLGLAMMLFFTVGLVFQAFIPVPAIPVIR